MERYRATRSRVGSVVLVVVVVGSIFGFQVLIFEHQRRIHEDACRGDTLFERGRISEGFESGAGLACGLDRMVVLVHTEVEPSGQGEHRTGSRIQ